MHDPETNTLFAGMPALILELSDKYKLALVSLAKSDSPENREKKIKASGIAEYFKIILVGGDNKDEMYERALKELDMTPDEVAIVDDRMIRGIAWGNRRGCQTIWFKQGKFADELPNEQTGQPTFTVTTVAELKDKLTRL